MMPRQVDGLAAKYQDDQKAVWEELFVTYNVPSEEQKEYHGE